MYTPLFMLVRSREAKAPVHWDSAVGSPVLSPPLPDGEGELASLLHHWSGLLRGLTLAGYRAIEIFVEYEPFSATRRLLLDVPTLGYGNTDVAPDELGGDARSTETPMLVAITVDPLWAFGENVGAPLALPLSPEPPRDPGWIPLDQLAAIDGVYPALHQTARGWLGFACDTESLGSARKSLEDRGLEVARILTTAIGEAWLREPAGRGEAAGLGWMLDERNWWFPGNSPAWLDAEARVLLDALKVVSDPIRPDASDPADSGHADLAEFLTEQVVRSSEPWTFKEAGSFGHETRTYADSATAVSAADAYLARVASLAPSDRASVIELKEHLDNRFMWTDAVLTMIEHGAIGVAHRLLPGMPSTGPPGQLAASAPEWTTPQLTGQWDGTASTDTLILNQAGAAISGFWQRRELTGLDRYIIDGELIDSSPLKFSVRCWHQTAVPAWYNHEGELGPPLDVGEITASQAPGRVPLLTLSVDIHGVGTLNYQFEKSLLGTRAHETESTLAFQAPQLKERIRTLRDAPLHQDETGAVGFLIRTAAEYVIRLLTERPTYRELEAMLDEFAEDVEEELGTFTENTDLLVTVQRLVQSALVEQRPPGGDNCLTVLMLMLRLRYDYPASIVLQNIYGLVIEVSPGDFLYQWRLTNIHMIGGAFWVSIADGTGTFELQRVNAKGKEIGPIVSRTIELSTGEFGFVFGPTFGPDDMADWNAFDPTMRDITPHLDGASFELSSVGGSWMTFESTFDVKARLTPTDDLPPVTGVVGATIFDSPLPELVTGDLDLDDFYDRVKKAKDLLDNLEELAKQGWKAKKVLIPEVKMTSTTGWIRKADGTPVPEFTPTALEEYLPGATAAGTFDTNKYDLTTKFRDGIRLVLLWHLASLTRLGELSIEGHASQIGTVDYNLKLSRDRAMSVLTAVYDILGPQLAIACGDVRVKAFGNSQAKGPAGSDLETDRRVDIVIAGRVRMRS